MSERPLQPRRRLGVKQTTRSARAVVDEIVAVLDVDRSRTTPRRHELALNDIGTVTLRLSGRSRSIRTPRTVRPARSS